MNQAQTVWWQQALSDLSIYIMMRQQGVATCHVLHYLQMTTEKVAKAYYWREGKSPPKSHAGFVQFVRFLGQIRLSSQQNRVAQLFGFQRYSDFQKCLGSFIHIAYDLERLAPDLALDGPNPEYPWPHDQPQQAPALYQFPIWDKLSRGQGRQLMRFLETAVKQFPAYAET
jgi:hypothetical protein